MRIPERILKALDAVKVDADARAHDEVLVLDRTSIPRLELILLRLEGLDGVLDEIDAAVRAIRSDSIHVAGDELSHRSSVLLLVAEAGADEGPSRLVVVPLGGVDDEDVRLRLRKVAAGGRRC